MDTNTRDHRDYGFAIGLLAGTCVGAGLAMLLAPWSGPVLRQRVTDSARGFGKRASEQYEQAGTYVDEAVDGLIQKGQSVRDEVAGAVAQGAREVERYATAAQTDPGREGRKHSEPSRSKSTPQSL
jgi:gas vesicle protein